MPIVIKTQKKTSNVLVTHYKFWGIIPLLKVHKSKGITRFYLFSFLPFKKTVSENLLIKKYVLGIPYKTVPNLKALQETLEAFVRSQHENSMASFHNQLDEKTTFILAQLAENIAHFQVQLEEKIQNALFSEQYKARMVQAAALSNTIFSAHQKIFPKYKNCNTGKDVVLIAGGPSLNSYSPINGTVHIGINTACKIERITFDYLFTADYKILGEETIECFCHAKAKEKFVVWRYCASNGIMYSTNFPESLIKKYELSCCYAEEQHPPDIYSPHVDIASNPLTIYCSCASLAMQFIFYTNPKRIFLVGCDCTNLGTWDGKERPFPAEGHVAMWQYFKEFAQIYYPETEIISINPVGLKGMFRDVYSLPEGGYSDSSIVETV